MKKIKILTLIAIILGISLTSLKPLSTGKELKYFIDDCNGLVEDANKLFKEYYNPNEYYSNNDGFDLISKNSLKKLNNSSEINFLDNDKQYWTISIENMYQDLSEENKKTFIDIKNNTPEFELAFSILTGEDNTETKVESSNEINDVKKKITKINTNIKRLIGAGSAAIAFSTISSMVAGINASSWITFVGWAVAAVLVASLIIYIVANWSYVKESFNSFVETLKRSYSRVAGLLNKAADQAKEESKNNPDVADDATSRNQMQRQVENGQAPKEVDRVDPAHNQYGQPHVHFKDGTSLNRDGTIHDRGRGRPNPSRKVWDWLHRNGWCQNGIK